MSRTHIEEGFVLTAEPRSIKDTVGSVWRARALIRMLARREFYVRYRRPTFGVLWIVGVPLLHAVVLAVVFSRIVKIDTGSNYPTFVLAGILPWTFFSGGITRGATSITEGAGLASKVYFPRASFPLLAVGSNVYAFLPSLLILIVVALVLGVPLGPGLLLLIPAFVLMVMLTAGFALVLAAITVYFRDIAFVLQAVTIAWFYGSAIFFPIDFVPPGPLQTAVVVNPATGIVQLFQAAVLGGGPRWVESVLWSAGWAVVMLVASLFLYRRYDRVFVDLL